MGLDDEERLLLLDPGTASGARPRHPGYGASYGAAMTAAGATSSSTTTSSANGSGAGCKDNDRWPRPKKVSYWKLFRYATAQDIVLLFVGTVFAILHGAGWPLLAIVFGHMTNAFIHQQQAGFYDGSDTNFTTQPPPETFMEAIRRSGGQSIFDPVTVLEYNITMNKFALTYVIIAAVVFVSSFIHVWCWTRACDRQLYRLRQELFYSLLRQDAAWFDRHRVSEVASRMNDDMERLREGMGDKMGLFIHYLSTFASGFATGFVESWELTLVIMSVTPLLAFASAFLGN